MENSEGGMLSALVKSRKVIAVALVAAMSPIMAGCFGKFPVTKTIYRLNKDMEPSILRQVVFWVFIIIPVYWVAMLADAVVFNLVDYWTGEGLAGGSTTNPDGSTVVLAPSADGREALMTLSRDGKVVSQVRFVRASDSLFEVRDAEGKLAGTVSRTPSGGLQFSDATGRVVGLLSAEQVASIKEHPVSVMDGGF
jgi:hypothetical protein